MYSYEIFEVFRAFSQSDGTKIWFGPRSDTHVALLQSNTGRFTKISKKLFQSHPKDFAVRQKLAEIFVVQCDFDPTFDRDQFSSTSRLSNPHWPNDDWCVRSLLITESPKTLGQYRYQFWVLGYIPYTGLAVFSLRFLVFLCTLRFRIFKVRVLNASE